MHYEEALTLQHTDGVKVRIESGAKSLWVPGYVSGDPHWIEVDGQKVVSTAVQTYGHGFLMAVTHTDIRRSVKKRISLGPPQNGRCDVKVDGRVVGLIENDATGFSYWSQGIAPGVRMPAKSFYRALLGCVQYYCAWIGNRGRLF